jgi:tetratricopeptide (TPR) repeat protein
MPRSLVALALAPLLGLVLPGHARAQSLEAVDPIPYADPIAVADALFSAGKARESYELLLPLVEADLGDADKLWRIARAGAVVGIDFDDHAEQNRWFDPSLYFARRAVELRPDDPEARYWRGVVAGRRALNAAARTATELAELVYEDAHFLLDADSLAAAGHNMLGKLAFEIMSLSRIERTLGRVFLSSSVLGDMSWEKAEHHLTRAADLEPEVVLYQYDLGALHRKRGRDEQAIACLTRALWLPSVQPVDTKVKALATELLGEIAR